VATRRFPIDKQWFSQHTWRLSNEREKERRVFYLTTLLVESLYRIGGGKCVWGSLMKWHWQRNTEVIGETWPTSATLSTINPTWTDLGMNWARASAVTIAPELWHGPKIIEAFFSITVKVCVHPPDYWVYIQYSLLGRSAALTRLNTTFQGLTPSPSSGKTENTDFI
jgi:hypothetical protein